MLYAHMNVVLPMNVGKKTGANSMAGKIMAVPVTCTFD